jgi:diacylglycerol kinase
MSNPLPSNKKLTFSSRMRSIGHAFRGIVTLINTEPNARIHGVATVVVVAAGILRRLNPAQWALIALAIGMVWVAEALNTAIEWLCDMVCEGKWHPVVQKIKDVAAAGVLIASIVSVAVAVCVFCL